MGLAFMRTLTKEQQAFATLPLEKDKNFNLGEAFKDNIDIDVSGIAGSELSDAQRSDLMGLVALYVGNMTDDHATVKMQEVAEHIDETRFTWIGKTDDDAVFYYRHPEPRHPDRV